MLGRQVAMFLREQPLPWGKGMLLMQFHFSHYSPLFPLFLPSRLLGRAPRSKALVLLL